MVLSGVEGPAGPRVETLGIEALEAFGIGSASDERGGTGCTVVVCAEGAVAAIETRGGSTGTREVEGLDPAGARSSVHAVLLAGGSAFGLEAAGGVVRALEERGIGRDVGLCRVPIVCGAVLFDLGCGDFRARPDAGMGYAAAASALERKSVAQRGNVGAGTGATVGKARGRDFCVKGGLSSTCLRMGELLVGAVVAVNCFGDLVDPERGRIVAGTRGDAAGSWADSESCVLAREGKGKDFFSGNTIIGCVLTNAALGKPEAKRIASVAHDGIARTVRPSHSRWDGDALFALSSGSVEADLDAVAILAVRAVEASILDAVASARSAYGVPSSSDWARGIR
jgi:L-aminopeptidase/D-esterase-like protein